MIPSVPAPARRVRLPAWRVALAALCAMPGAVTGDTLSLGKDGPKTAREGDLIEYRLEVVNQGTAGVEPVEVRDTLPAALEFVQAVSTPTGMFDPASGVWTVPRLGTGAEDRAAELRLQVLVRSDLLSDPNATVTAVNQAALLAPEPAEPLEAQAITRILCAFCIDWEILSVGFNSEHRSRLPDIYESRYFLDVLVANNGPVASEGTVAATRFDVSGGRFSPVPTLQPAEPVAVSLGAGESRTITFATDWVEGPYSTYTLSWEFAVSDLSLLDPVLPNTAGGSRTGEVDERDDDQCVIAVAASGSYLEPHVRSVRRFRDQTLMRSRPGQMLVAWYYAFSPSGARYIAHNETLRTMTRLALTPLVLAIEHPVSASAAFGALLMLVFRARIPAVRVALAKTRSMALPPYPRG